MGLYSETSIMIDQIIILGNNQTQTFYPELKVADDLIQMIMSSLSIVVVLYTMFKAGAFHCRMTKQFVFILVLYLIVYLTRELKPLIEAIKAESID